MNTCKIGIVGCGLMGRGIAQIAAEAGHTVFIYDSSQQAREHALEKMRGGLTRKLEQKLLDKTGLEGTLSRLQFVDSLNGLIDCDIVLEAIVENLDAKKQLMAKLDEICPPETILLTNTSALSVTEMAEATQRRDRFAGLHFHLPVTRIRLVDVISGEHTSEETLQKVIELGESLRREVVVVKDIPGFILNRLLMPYILDAIRFEEEGGADRDAIDLSMKLGCNHPMGPLLLADFIGLDTLHSAATTMYKKIGEERFRPPVTLVQKVQAGDTGVKSGRGFYNHTNPQNEGDRKAQLILQMAGLLQ